MAPKSCLIGLNDLNLFLLFFLLLPIPSKIELIYYKNVLNQFINEVKNEDYLDSASFNLMFIPFVGVDKGGHRLGYGGGYFDRSLGNISSTGKDPIIVGLGYDFQVLEEDFAESHDLKYDIVITQTRIHSYS